MWPFRNRIRHNTIDIFMKSGNVVHLTHVIECNMKSDEVGITSLELKFGIEFRRPYLMIDSVDLKNIEAVVATPY